MTKFYVKEYRDKVYEDGTNVNEMLRLARAHLETARHLTVFDYPIDDLAFEIHQWV